MLINNNDAVIMIKIKLDLFVPFNDKNSQLLKYILFLYLHILIFIKSASTEVIL